MSVPQDQRRLTISEETYLALVEYAKVEKKRMDNPLIAEMITPLSLAQHILQNEVQKRGYYKKQPLSPPRDYMSVCVKERSEKVRSGEA